MAYLEECPVNRTFARFLTRHFHSRSLMKSVSAPQLSRSNDILLRRDAQAWLVTYARTIPCPLADQRYVRTYLCGEDNPAVLASKWHGRCPQGESDRAVNTGDHRHGHNSQLYTSDRYHGRHPHARRSHRCVDYHHTSAQLLSGSISGKNVLFAFTAQCGWSNLSKWTLKVLDVVLCPLP